MILQSIYNSNYLTNKFLKECIYKNQIESNHKKKEYF